MNQNPYDILIDVLTIIDYQKDKEEFAKKFVDVCLSETINESIKQLPEEKKNGLNLRFDTPQNLHNSAEILRRKIKPEEFKSILTNVTSRLFTDYVETILPALDEKKQEQLLEYIEDFKQ